VASGVTFSESGRLPGLDGLRGIAILAVMAYHTRDAGERGQSLWSLGYLGVDLFFVLSGFLITGILLDSRGQLGAARAFYVRRVLRIVPIYYVLVLALVVLPPFGDTASGTVRSLQPWYWLYATNWWAILHPGQYLPQSSWVVWSLAIEEQFYLVWPWIVWRSRSVLSVSLGLAAAALVLRLALHAAGWSWWSLRNLPFGVMDTLCIGAALAVLYRDPVRWPRVQRSAGIWLVAALVWAVPIGARSPWFGSVVAVGCGALTVLALQRPTAVLDRGFLPSLGRVSYAVYLFHSYILLAVVLTMPRWPLLARYGIAVAFTYALARISWLLIEQPFLSLKRLVPMPRRHGPAAVGAPSMERQAY
jgi:peptidoglycan/LPS O-acetylase OafA/YrhL